MVRTSSNEGYISGSQRILGKDKISGGAMRHVLTFINISLCDSIKTFNNDIKELAKIEKENKNIITNTKPKTNSLAYKYMRSL